MKQRPNYLSQENSFYMENHLLMPLKEINIIECFSTNIDNANRGFRESNLLHFLGIRS